MIEEIEKLDKQGPRKVGLVTGSIVVVLFGILLPLLFGFDYPLWPWYLGGSLAVLALVIPAALNPVYHGWMRFGLVMGWFSSRLVLGVIFYCIFMPVSFIFRLRGVDPLQRRLDASVTSYRKQSAIRDIKHMEKPF